jgi:hypothetical protein
MAKHRANRFSSNWEFELRYYKRKLQAFMKRVLRSITRGKA